MLALALIVACGDPPPTWGQDVKPILDAECATCHHDGGNAPFALVTYADAQAMAPTIAAVVEAGTMPPWPPGADCNTYANERVLTAEQKATLRAWVDAGALEGKAPETPLYTPSSVHLEPADFTGTVPGFVPQIDTDDEYRCFVLDSVDEDRWLAASEVIPGSQPVHHVLVYALPGEAVAAIPAPDDGRLGYDCVTAPLPGLAELSNIDLDDLDELGGGFPTQVGSWVPGGGVDRLPDGYGIAVPAGSVIVAQVHYSALGGDATADATEVRLDWLDAPPDQLVITSAVYDYELDIRPGVLEAEFTRVLPYYGGDPLVLHTVSGHMHLLATKLRAEVTDADGAESCLLDIPDWDFGWQEAYAFEQDVQIASGSHVSLTCTYDNSAEHQPFVDGVQQEPQQVGWGEDTLDEMCMLYVTRVKPFVAPLPPEAPPCETAADCMAACPDGSVDCVLSCDEASMVCSACAVVGGWDCASQCFAPFLAAQDCATDCFESGALLGGNIGACFKAECPDAYEPVISCMDEAIANGECDAQMADCGVAL